MSIITPEWVRDAVFYQVFPDRFARSGRVEAPGPLESWDEPPTTDGFKGGDLYGVIDRLDHIQALGATALYLNPVFASASNHRYHTYDYYAVDPLLGGNEALRALIDACHARGMKVVLDGVFNHASRGFWPFNHVLECGLGSPYVDWFHIDREMLASGRSLRAYPDESLRRALEEERRRGRGEHHEGTVAGTESLLSLGYRAWWDLPALPKLNTDNPKVREYIFDVAEHWIRFGADGWRLDVAAEIDDDDFWREFRRRVKAIDPEAYIVAEIWHEDHRWLKGDQFDAYMNYPVGFAALSFCAGSHRDERVIRQHGEVGENVRRDDGPTFVERLGHALTAYDPAINAVQMNLIDSHDTPRLRTMCAGDIDGQRLTTLVLLTVGGAPCIYYGDEIGMAGEQDPYSRGAFPADESAWDRDLLAFYRGAIAVRNRSRALRRGEFAIAGAAGMTAAYTRRDGEDAFVVCINAGDEPARLDLSLPGLDGRALDPVTWEGWPWGSGETVLVDGAAAVDLPARSARVLRAR
jgi:cyclomaltodextrinase / maltogenic alpha-amylase / neopullulanase